MPSITAAGVLIMLSAGRPMLASIPFIMPFFSSSTCHAIVRSRKFIHIGRMNTNTINPFLPSLLSFNASPSGKARSRQITVLAKARSRESPRALACSPLAIATRFASVKAPLLSVMP